MSETFNLRSLVVNLSTPKNVIMDRFRQTIDSIIQPFTTLTNVEQETTSMSEIPLNRCPSQSISSSSESSNLSQNYSCASRSIPTVKQNSMSNFQILSNRFSRDQSLFRRQASESNRVDERISSRPIYHDNPPVDVHALLNTTNPEKRKVSDRSRSLIRQSTDVTCTFPIRRMESIEIPGLNGVKSIRYINDNLGKLEPDLYKKQTLQNDPSYDSGQINFTLFYNQSLTSLIITIVSIEHLPYRNSKILPNPFLKLTLLPDRRKKFQSKVYKHTQSTQFNEVFQFSIAYEHLCKRILLLSLYDFRRSSKRNLIGTVKIDDFIAMPELTAQEITLTKSIVPGTESDPDLGELTVSLCYLPNAKRLTVTIVKANALKPMDITGKSDPYVKVILLINGRRIRKKKTAVFFNTLNPNYNESLVFDLASEERENTDLIFQVIDYDRVGSNELIGCIGIGIHFDGLSRDHWYQMLEHPHEPITQIYSLCETMPTVKCPNGNQIK